MYNRNMFKVNMGWYVWSAFTFWLGALFFVFSAIDKDIIQIIICLIIFLGMSIWGHIAVSPLFYSHGRYIEGFVCGSILGISIAAFIISVIVYLIGWNLLVIFLSVTALPFLLLLYILKRKKTRIISQLQPIKSINPVILIIPLIIVTLFFYFPFKNLGAEAGDKYLFAWLFGHDFINRIVQAVSLSRGLPFDSFHFSGETLSYYWLAYIYPALVYKLSFISLNMQKIMQLSVLFYSLLCISAIVIFLWRLTKGIKVLLILLIMALISYSYIYFYTLFLYLWKQLMGNYSIEVFGYTLSYFSGFSHTFYSFFLVQPQAALGIAIMLMIIALYNERDKTLYGFALIGLLLGLLFGAEATMGIMLLLWFGCISFFNLYSNKKERYSILKNHGISYLLAGIIYISLFAIEMYSFQTGKGVLVVKPNFFAILMSPLYFPLEYGPLFILGIAGIVKVFKAKEPMVSWIYQFIILMVIALFFVFFIINPTESQFGLLKAARIIPFCLLALTAYLLEDGFIMARKKIIIAGLILLAVPSFFTDNYIASDVSNPSTYVRKADIEATNWIKKNLPLEAIIQAEPNYPEIENEKKPLYSYSLIPIFAERRTAIGEWKASSQEHSRPSEVRERFHSVKKMFFTTDIYECVQILKKYNIEYIYIGELEKKMYPNGVRKFDIYKVYFEKVYSHSNVTILKVQNL